VALIYAKLPNDTEELKQQLLAKDAQVDALMAEVIRLRHWRFGRSSEAMPPELAPELPLTGGEVTQAETPAPSIDHKLPRLMSVDAPRAHREGRRPVRTLPAELPRVIRVHAPTLCTCPDCGSALRKLG
jgi:hypothetical protein